MTVYAYLDKNIKAQNIRELTHDIPCAYISSMEGSIIPADAEMVFVHGVLRGNGEIIKQAIERGIPWAYMDNGYFGTYKRVILNATAPITIRRGKRFEHDIRLQPWRGGTGKNILVLPPSPPYMDTFGARDFLNHLVHNINRFTDKNIVVRAKPAKGKLARPWQEQLDDAYCVITWGSALALDAMIQGVPTISMGWCPALAASKKLEDLSSITELEREPDRMAILDNLTWSSFEKYELRDAYKIMMENAACKRL